MNGFRVSRMIVVAALMATLSVGSFAMGMTFFGVGMGTAFLLYWGRWRRVRETQARGLDLATD